MVKYLIVAQKLGNYIFTWPANGYSTPMALVRILVDGYSLSHN